MRCGRNTDHHAQALIATLAVALVALVASSNLAVRAGDAMKIASDGTVHSVSAGFELAVGNSNPIVHVAQSPSGDSVTRVLPGTGSCGNFHPAIEIDPVTDLPVAVWTHVEHGEADVYLARFDGTQWSYPIAVAPGRGDDIDPELRIGQTLVHVLWRRQISGGGVVLLRTILDRASLARVLGPEHLSTDGVPLVYPEGGSVDGADSTADAPGSEDSFVVEEVWDGDPQTLHILIVYGIRDEPMPVGYRQGFVLPPGTGDVTDPAAAWIGSRFVLSFVSGNQFFYTIYENGEWSDLRRINLDGGITAAEARREMEQMLLRTDPDS